MHHVKTVSRYVLAVFMIVAGVLHFVNKDFYLKIMPPYLPAHRELVYLSGVCEIALGALLLVPRFTRLAAWGIILLLIAVYPREHLPLSTSRGAARPCLDTLIAIAAARGVHRLGLVANSALLRRRQERLASAICEWP